MRRPSVGMRRWGCREALRAQALLRHLAEELCAGWLLVGLAGRRGSRVDAVRCAMAMPVKRPGASCRRGVPVGMRGGLSVRYGIVPGDGLRRLLCHHVDCSDGRLA